MTLKSLSEIPPALCSGGLTRNGGTENPPALRSGGQARLHAKDRIKHCGSL